MGATYEFWLEDDGGNRIMLLRNPFSASFSRSSVGYGTFQADYLYDDVLKSINPAFQPDWRVSCWRSPATGYPKRNERTYILREPIIYTREDSVKVIQYIGRDGLDLVGRRVIPQSSSSSYASKTACIDDMMKAIVREQMLYGSCVDETGALDNSRALPNGEFFVDADVSLGPSVSRVFNDRYVLDALKELRETSFSLNAINGTQRIYFDVVESQLPGSTRFGWTFRTFAGVRGVDRTNGVEFSVENENLKTPQYRVAYQDEVNAVFVKNTTSTSEVLDSTRISSSRWNRRESIKFVNSDSSGLSFTAAGNQELGANVPLKELTAIFMSTPGDKNTPRSLYGIDWDFGDRLRVSYAGMQFQTDVKIVYFSVNQNGEENITGRNRVN